MMRFRRFVLYAAVGATGTLVQYVVLFCLVHFRIFGPLTASCIGAIAGAAVNYVLNYRVTFGSTANHASTATRFFAVAAIGLCVNWACMAALISGLGVAYLAAQCGSTLVVLGLTYSANSMWSFAVRERV